MPTPPVIEKQLVDIDFSRGLDESVRPEHLDWMKALKVADNVCFEDQGEMKPRKGVKSLTGTDENGSSYGPVYRLLPTTDGLGMVGAGFRMYQYDEGGGKVLPRNRLPEFSVNPTILSSWPESVANNKALGTCMNDKYRAILHTTAGGTLDDGFVALVITDRFSGAVVRSYQIPGEQSSGGNACMCLVNGRYIHVFVGSYLLGAGVTVVYQFDLNSLPTSLPSKVALSNDHRVVGCVDITDYSIVLMENGYLSKVSTSPAEAATGQATGFSVTTGIAKNSAGTSIYVAGITATPRKRIQVLSDALAVTRTVTETAAAISATDTVRVAVDGSETAYAVSYRGVSTGTFAAQVDTVSSIATDFTKVASMPNWGENSAPFYFPANGKVYVALQKAVWEANLDTSTVTRDAIAGAVVLVDLTELTWTGAGKAFRAAAALDVYQDVSELEESTGRGSYHYNVQAPFYYTDNTGHYMTIGGAMKSTFGSVAYEFRELKYLDPSAISADTDAISGGIVQSYDGLAAQEFGFFDTPSIALETNAASGDVDAGIHNYVVVFETKDSKGRSHFSRCSRVCSVVNDAGDSVDIQITAPSVTNHKRNHVSFTGTDLSNGAVARIYRTVAGGTQYHLLASVRADGGASAHNTLTYSDTTADADLESNPLLYRQPGTPATALDRYHAVAGRYVMRWKDRVFFFRGNTIFYSSFAVDGEAPWFNPAYRIVVDDGVGPITGLSQMDGILVVFKRNAVYLVDGDGPPENGGSGAEFSPPRRVMGEYGCVDPRTIITTPKGIMFRSSRGIELLNRSLQVDFIGQRVYRTVDAHPANGGAAFDRARGRCIWAIGESASAPGAPISAEGKLVVYEVTSDTWSTHTMRNFGGLGWAFQDVAFLPVNLSGDNLHTTEHLFFGCAGFGSDAGRLWVEDGNLDVVGSTSYFVPITVETGYVKAPSKQDRIRVSDLLVAGILEAPCTLTVSYAPDYGPTYTTIRTWSLSTPGLAQVEAQPAKELVQSMSFRITTSDPGSPGDGSQIEFFGLSVKVGIKGGGAKLSAAQKG